MIIKLFKLTVLMILVGIFTVGCSNILPAKMPLNESIKESLNSKGDDHDFLNDEVFLDLVDDYVNNIPDIDKKIQYAIGNINEKNNVPEIVVFMNKNPDIVDSKVELVVYEFNGDSYVILDRVDMNHDKSNYLLEIGKISQNQNGIYLSNNVGAHSTITYGFILEDGKLKSILNENKLALISLQAKNEISDIDNDGILEFSIYTVNPESDTDSADNKDTMMTIWYKWDGKDSANVVMTETNSIAISMDNSQLTELLDSYNTMKLENLLPSLDENIKDYNINEATKILKEYIQRLEANFQNINQSSLLENAFKRKDQHNISLENLNSQSYLSVNDSLDSVVKSFLLDNLSLGYKLAETESSYYFILDNQMFIDKYEPYISREYLSYLKIKAFNSNDPYLKDGAFTINRDILSERIVSIENFKLRFPYSSFIPELNSIYGEYVRTFILGSVNSPNYDTETKLYSSGSISVFRKALNDYPNTHFADVLDFVIKDLASNGNIISSEFKEDIEGQI